MTTTPSIKYLTLPCPICLESPFEVEPTKSHTWYGHSVTSNPSIPNEKILHGICAQCMPRVPLASRAKCPSCREVFAEGALEKFTVKSDGTLDASEALSEIEEGLNGASPKRKRVVEPLIIQVRAIPEADDLLENMRPCHTLAIETSAGILSAGVIVLVTVTAVFPTAAVVAAPIVAFTSTASLLTILAVLLVPPTVSTNNNQADQNDSLVSSGTV